MGQIKNTIHYNHKFSLKGIAVKRFLFFQITLIVLINKPEKYRDSFTLTFKCFTKEAKTKQKVKEVWSTASNLSTSIFEYSCIELLHVSKVIYQMCKQ